MNIQVMIGEVKVGHDANTLRATLGSCVGISFHWPKKNLTGLAHCLLPVSPEKSSEISAKYVSQAIPSLMAMMKIKASDIPEIEVNLAGGGNMIFQFSKNNNHIGTKNLEQAKSMLQDLGFNVRSIDAGGEQGRQMSVNCSSGEVTVTKIPRAGEVSCEA